MLKFYFNGSPNPTKVALFLEEAGLAYEPIAIDTRRGEQFESRLCCDAFFWRTGAHRPVAGSFSDVVRRSRFSPRRSGTGRCGLGSARGCSQSGSTSVGIPSRPS